MLLVSASVHARIGRATAIASQADLGIALASLSGLILASTFAPAQAQIVTPDGTLPTTVIPDAATNRFTVTGGSTQGVNLFQSFDTFSPADYSIVFDLSGEPFGNQIERIFSRITGASTSDINGLGLRMILRRSPTPLGTSAKPTNSSDSSTRPSSFRRLP